MIPLFSKNGLTVLESLSFTQTLYAFDFDGTLAKIVRVPSQAHMSTTTMALLNNLSALAPVAIISGRSIEDLKQRIEFQPTYLIGNHGLEGLDKNSRSLVEARKTCVGWDRILRNMCFDVGIEIENKFYSIALHYRRARNKSLARNQIREAIKTLYPTPRIILGKSVFNLLPPNAPHKGAALLDIIQKSKAKHAFYIGDDDTDEDIFSMPFVTGQLMTVRVGKKKTSQANYFIERQSDINRLLKMLIRFNTPSKIKRELSL